jgi:hypothetical protein
VGDQPNRAFGCIMLAGRAAKTYGIDGFLKCQMLGEASLMVWAGATLSIDRVFFLFCSFPLSKPRAEGKERGPQNGNWGCVQ